ncbi:MAG: DUF4382 domain-containing protein [Chitinophagaceae bacterium]|nr:DUF4382 domain-containing protein [Chitinophagaceae bacterium]
MKLHAKPLMVVGSLLLSLSVLFYACQKESSANGTIPAGQIKLSVYLTDGPYDFQNVLIDIQQIAVKVDTCQHYGDEDHDQPGCDDDHDQRNSDCEIWDTLNIRPGVYDLVQLRNGLDTLLASDFVLNGKIKRIKFTLGDNNSVIVDSTSYPLRLLNNQHFVYVNIKREHLDSLSSNNLQMFLDVDLSRSIKFFNGQYWLKPVIKPFGRHSSGEIEGKVRPVGSFGTIKAFNTTDTAFALPWSEGEFKIRGLQEGTYSLFIQGINGYSDTTISNIQVTRNRDTKLVTIQLHQ